MKKAVLLFSLLMASASVQAQTITLGPITKLAYCVGDTVFVPYQASGTFNTNNTFVGQLSNSDGSFVAITNGSVISSLTGKSFVVATSSGQHFRVRVISTDPYSESSNNGTDIVINDPPMPEVFAFSRGRMMSVFYGSGIAGHFADFADGVNEASGSSWLWQFDQDAQPSVSSTQNAHILYPSPGVKTGKLTVTNPPGCRWVDDFVFPVFSCSPVIQRGVRIVTGSEDEASKAGSNVVWVKSGGSYTTEYTDTVFVEAGASLRVASGAGGLYYLKRGASYYEVERTAPLVTIILADSTPIACDSSKDNLLHCSNLTFDYSQVNASVAQPETSSILIRQSGDALFVEGEGNVETRILNLLGAEMLSKRGAGALDLDLSPLPAGIYFAIVQSGDMREVKRIAVVH